MPPSNPVGELMQKTFEKLMIDGSSDEKLAFTAGIVEGIEQLIGITRAGHPDLDPDVVFEMLRAKILLTAACADVVDAFDKDMQAFAIAQLEKLCKVHNKPPVENPFSRTSETKSGIDTPEAPL